MMPPLSQHLPKFFEPAADWSVAARVEPGAKGEAVVGVIMESAAGLRVGLGLPLGWAENYEDRDMEAAGLIVAAEIFKRLSVKLADEALARAGA